MTTKRMKKHCDDFAMVCVVPVKKVIEYRDTVIYLDRVVPVKLPPVTITIRDTVLVTNNENKPISGAKVHISPIHRVDGIIKIDAIIRNNNLIVNVELIDSTILVPIKDTIYLKAAIKETTTENNIILPPVKFIPWLYKLAMWILLIEISILIGWVAWTYFLKKASFVKNIIGIFT
jgi:hypothetical protein